MLTIVPVTNEKPIFEYHRKLAAPHFFDTDYPTWLHSFQSDTDGEGRELFRDVRAMAAYDTGTLVGFVQYGRTAFGFDARGEISAEISYPVIRSLYFDEGRQDAGALLLQTALDALGSRETLYAFFHYFGMCCYARHGKLHEGFAWIEDLLFQKGFAVEHENVYFSATLSGGEPAAVTLRAGHVTPGQHQTFDFILGDDQVGGCEVHYVDPRGIAYLRWIYVNDNVQNRGVGSACMSALKQALYEKGFTRLDTDTALDNLRAQRYYEKNHFLLQGITRSYLRKHIPE